MLHEISSDTTWIGTPSSNPKASGARTPQADT